MIPQVMSFFDLEKYLLRSLTVRETVKKSKASQVCSWATMPSQPSLRHPIAVCALLNNSWEGEMGLGVCIKGRAADKGPGRPRLTQAQKATAKKAHCWRLSIRRSRHGFGTGSRGGRREEKREAR